MVTISHLRMPAQHPVTAPLFLCAANGPGVATKNGPSI